MFRTLLTISLIFCSFSVSSLSQEQLMDSWPEFTPYDSSQADQSVSEWEFSLKNVRYQGMIVPKRFLSVDRFADKYPSMTPYHYTLNNPVRFIDVNGDTVKFDDPNLQQQHEAFYNQKDKNGNYVNTIYRDQYDKLNASDIVYKVAIANLGGPDNSGRVVKGDMITDGTNVIFQIDINQGATIGQQLSHEFVHGLQFESGKLHFGVTEDGGWTTAGNTIGTELGAFAGQQTPEAWWNPGNQQSNIQQVEQLYPQHIGKRPDILPPAFGKRTVERNQSFFGIFPDP